MRRTAASTLALTLAATGLSLAVTATGTASASGTPAPAAAAPAPAAEVPPARATRTQVSTTDRVRDVMFVGNNWEGTADVLRFKPAPDPRKIKAAAHCHQTRRGRHKLGTLHSR